MRSICIVVLAVALNSFAITQGYAQKSTTTELLSSEVLAGLKFRGIGPALMSGRIADIAIHPENSHTWYVAVGSGGVWKTENAGTTWKPIFDNYGSYSIGCITIDPGNPNRIWVGTGENVGGRHVGYGDGIYRSDDGGISWKNMGLKASEHISKIIVHPDNSDIVWVAAQGPLWSKGGERGVFKTTDGGQNWKLVLGDNEWIGATEIVIDPRNPDRLYAATWQRHRTVAAYLGGGPGTGLYSSTDGGENWTKLTKGLPASNMGKIGLTISPQQPDVLYAAIELDRRKGGLYKSTNRGASWTKQSDAVSGGTGPHYYQELYACPHYFDKIFLVDVRLQISHDGGKNFDRVSNRNIHVDYHAVAFKKDDPNYLLVGNDGGLYESFDDQKTWKFIANLPVTQFYKVAVDDDGPFYNVYGGTQDNNTQGGPSRTDNVHGIRNADWFVTLFGDGHQPATEPGNPDIVYSQWQRGNLVRFDRRTGEYIFIKPQPEEDEGIERYNWDAPILVSPHNPAHLYFASQRVWYSTDRGDSWTAISPDLTHAKERIEQPIMGSKWSWDNPWDLFAMSDYSSITSLSESPVKQGLLYAGTDDGLIQRTDDGGATWHKIEVGSLPGVPSTAFVNDIKADLFDENTVYVALDNHKYGDYKPYLFKSTNKGKSWQSITANIPDRSLVWRVVQDHIKPELLFAATEFGIYFTIDGGSQWVQLKGGLPVISFRDLAIQSRENDLVVASFGRGFYILDDYSPLREISPEQLNAEAHLFQSRKAWWYIERNLLGSNQKASQGDSYFVADNPPFGAVFTYYLKETYPTAKSERQKSEKERIENEQEVPFPGWELLKEEMQEDEPKVWIFISDSQGQFIQRIEGKASKGIHRIDWNLQYPSTSAVRSATSSWEPRSVMVAPGTYTATLMKQADGQYAQLSEPINFEVVPLRSGTLEGASPEEVVAFWQEIQALRRATSAASIALRNAIKRMDLLRTAYTRAPRQSPSLEIEIIALKKQLLDLDEEINGHPAKREVGESSAPSFNSYLSAASFGTASSTYGPTPSHRRSLEIAQGKFATVRGQLEDLRQNQIPALEQKIIAAGAPWIEGQELPEGE